MQTRMDDGTGTGQCARKDGVRRTMRGEGKNSEREGTVEARAPVGEEEDGDGERTWVREWYHGMTTPIRGAGGTVEDGGKE
jgi:hypothetical protein